MAELNFPNAVTSEKDFYGRKDGLRQIEKILLTRQRVPVMVIGERRTGKTSLMNVMVRRLQSLNNADLPMFVYLPIEPRGISTFHAFAQAILVRMSAYLWKLRPELSQESPQQAPLVETIEQFELHFNRLLGHIGKETFLVAIDEFDEIVRQAQGHELSRILGLIYHLVEKTEKPIAFFFTMTRIPDAMRDEIPSSLVTMAQVLDLCPLDSREMADLVTSICSPRLEWTECAIKQLERISGGHPYITKLILAQLLAAAPPEGPVEVNQSLLQTAVSLALNDPRTDHVFENLYSVHFNAQEKELLLFLARRRGPLLAREVISAVGASWVTVARRLAKRHYLLEDDKGFDFRATFMGEWLRGWIAYEEECAQYNTLLGKLLVPKEIEVNTITGQVSVMGVPVRLSAQEFAILNYLSERAGQLVYREEIVDQVWGTSEGISDQVVDTAFYRLRKKIGDQGQYIETIPGQGFRLHRAVRVAAPGGSKSRGNPKGGLL